MAFFSKFCFLLPHFIDINKCHNAEEEVYLLANEIKKADSCIYHNDRKLREVNRALINKTHELNKAIKVKSEFMANMSHEIRTIMSQKNMSNILKIQHLVYYPSLTKF